MQARTDLFNKQRCQSTSHKLKSGFPLPIPLPPPFQTLARKEAGQMSREDQAIRKIEKGRLDGSSQDIDTTPDVLNQLRNEHPTGPANPFNHPNPPGRAMPTLTPD
ncbi:hypothetical protein C366_02686 [Cryptococcus neoformans Tu401-1]|nr:hypothetical protein AYX15_05890 [Cryptococcus neoformans var. grubii]OXG18581.1 hypothetical protein C366_02686 [Cryptococcus neoformans var. grubii Tu401-1]